MLAVFSSVFLFSQLGPFVYASSALFIGMKRREEERGMSARNRCGFVFLLICNLTVISVRGIGRLLGISKSSAHRCIKAINMRNTQEESWIWETPNGQQWLFRMIFAALFVFGIMSGIGIEKISFFLTLLHLEKHIGISPSSLRKLMKTMEEKVLEYKKIQEESHTLNSNRDVVVGGDETFFEDIILVLMDLSSGYIFMEEESDNRTYKTWSDKVKDVIAKFGINVKYMVSDRAKALIKLASECMNCTSIADLFHASNEIVKLFGLKLNNKLIAIRVKLAKEAAALAIMTNINSSTINKQQALIDELMKEETLIISGIDKYKSIITNLSLIVHPFDIKSGINNTSSDVYAGLMGLVIQINSLQEEFNIVDNQNRANKFNNQIEDIASLIDAWWLWVNKELDTIDQERRIWLIEALLPALYWKSQAEKTKNPELKKAYLTAWQKAKSALDNHCFTQDVTAEEISRWHDWCEWMISKFQRASSAVEGRNGFLSQMHHNGRGISGRRLKVLTVIHNFVIRRPDGTTAAQRLYETDFPDLFEWLITQMPELPLPRQRRLATNVSG